MSEIAFINIIKHIKTHNKNTLLYKNLKRKTIGYYLFLNYWSLLSLLKYKT